MIHPKTLLAEWVTRSSLCQTWWTRSAATAAGFSSTPRTIVFGQSTQNNIRLAILSMPPDR